MKNLNPKIGYVYVYLVLFVLLLILFNIDFFYYQALFSFYSFVIGINVIALFVGFSIFAKSSDISIVKIPILIFGTLAGFVILSSFLFENYNTYPVYILSSFLFLLVLHYLFNFYPDLSQTLAKGISIIAIAEAGYCLVQYFGFASGNNQFFEVTGTWVNPNVTAMFLAMALPLLLTFLNSKHKNMVIGGLLILIFALITLKCRTALLGGLVATIVFYAQKSNAKAYFKQTKNRSTVYLLAIIVLSISIPIANYLYTQKKESADGRKIIWQLSAKMIAEKPFFGYGYGVFSKNYNTYQAAFLSENPAIFQDNKQIGTVKMAYNEILQNGVEGGITGAVIFVLLMGSLLWFPKYRIKAQPEEYADLKTGHACYAAIVAFCVMSLVNFSVQAIPVWFLFIVYSAFITTKIPAIRLSKNLTLNKIIDKKLSFATGLLCVTASVYLCYFTFALATTDRQNKLNLIQAQKGELNEALGKMPALKQNLYFYESYWTNYADLLMKNKSYDLALVKLREAKRFSADPMLFIKSGICYQKINNYSAAMTEFKQAVLLDPSKFRNRHLLLVAYDKLGDATNAVQVAKNIIDLTPKIPSAKVNQYKKSATDYLRNANVTYPRKPYTPL